MAKDFDTVIIGAGVIGLAIAYTLAKRGQEILIVERNSTFGEETSSRNSEVIHAGIYYPAGSLKARLCVQGKELLYDYCKTNNVPFQKTGKLIVATATSEIETLNTIKQKAEQNQVNDLRLLSAEEITVLEPDLFALKALYSPSTGIIDTHQYMLSLVGRIQEFGGMIAYRSAFHSAAPIEGGYRLSCTDGDVSCTNLINASGLDSQHTAVQIRSLEPKTIPKRYLTKGSYFTMAKPSPFKRLIYPVPNTASLGVHVTLDLAGQIRFGPDQEWVETLDYAVDPARADGFYDAIRKYYPNLEDNCLQPAYSGIRPKIQGPNDAMKDFEIQGPSDHGRQGLICLYGMESPGLTSSLAIGDYVADLLRI